MRYHLYPVGWQESKLENKNYFDKYVENLNNHTSPVGMENGVTVQKTVAQ